MNRAFVIATTTAALTTALTAPAMGEQIYGLTNLQELVTFDSDTRVVTSTTGLAGFSITGQILVSIDVRPATGELFGLSNQNNLFIINPADGTSTQVGGTIPTTDLSGGLKAIDFNPTVDRLRIVSINDNNLRLNPNDGTYIVDGTLAFSAGDVNEGDNPAVVNAAYTNSFDGSTSTMLFDIDATNDVLVRQNPANSGQLQTVGSLGFDIVSSGGFTGFEISGQTDTAYLVGNKLGGGGLTASSLYTVDLTTGAATLAGAVTGVNGSFRDIAVVAVPEPGSLALLGLGGLTLLRRRRA